jgi:carbamoyltransferase
MSTAPRQHFLPLPEQHRLSGKGATVLMLDDGIAGADVLGNDFTAISPPRRGPTGDHSFRVASICGDAQPVGAPAGIAPAARFLSLDRALLKSDAFMPTLRSVIEAMGPVDVVCVAWSAPADEALARAGTAWAAELAWQGTLVVAAAGHDGDGRVRMPALWRDVLAVGVHDEAFFPQPYCSRSLAFAKPELFVPDADLSARNHAGDPAPIRGTSAAAAVVAGLAALHVEYLKAHGRPRSAALLKASMLSATCAMRDGKGRALAPERSFSEPTWLRLEGGGLGNLETRYRLATAGARSATIAVVAASACVESRFVSSGPLIEMELLCGGERLSVSSRAGHLIFDLPDAWFGPFEVRLRVSGAHGPVGVVARDAAERRSPQQRSLRREPITLGISASHNASACVLVGREVRRAVQLERISRSKADGEPFLHSEAAANYCLDSLSLRRADVDAFAYNCQPVLPGWTGLSRPLASSRFSLFDPYAPDAWFVSHHLAHAFAAYCASPFRDAVVVVADGAGGGVAGLEGDLVLDGPAMRDYLVRQVDRPPPIHVFSVYRFDERGYRLVSREHAASFNPRCGSSSLGETYAAVSQYVFGNWLDGGKLMGLAPYGRRDAQPSRLIRNDAGELAFDARWKLEHCDVEVGDPLQHADLAARIQADLEEALVDRVRKAVAAVECRNLVFTGGIALNCVANERIRHESGCSQAFFFPASNDAGIAIGAAQAAAFRRTGSTREPPTTWCEHLGHPYDGRDYEVAIEPWRDVLDVQPYSRVDVAQILARGGVIAWFDGAGEFGPRALGHRSILASPKSVETWRFINRRVKGREDFRPFAPVVAEERASDYFELLEPSPFMLRVVRVRDEHRGLLGAVRHVNGTARVQTLAAFVVPTLHALLLEMEAHNHPPILLNTSLNVAGKPIVETPAEAVELLLITPIDALVLGSLVLRRRRPPDGSPTPRSVLSLAPGAVVKREDRRGSREFSITAGAPRGTVRIDEGTHVLLSTLDGARPLSGFATELAGGTDHAPVSPLMVALWAQGMLVYHGEHGD